MTRRQWARLLGIAVVLFVAFLLLAPVKASYINRVGSDTIEYRTASCGTPILSMVGGRPGLGGGSPHPIGAVNARQACKGSAGRRVAGGVSLLLVVALFLALAAHRRNRAHLTDDLAKA